MPNYASSRYRELRGKLILGHRIRCQLMTMVILSSVACTTACGPGGSSSQLQKTLVDGLFLRKVGVPDRRLSYLNSILLNPSAGTDATILQTTHTFGTGRVVRFQPSTGRTEYLELTGAQGAWAAVRRGDEVYIGSHMPGVLYHMVADSPALRAIPIPRSAKGQFDFIWSIDFGSDGRLYLGTYPEAALLRYDPESNSFANLGVMSPGENYVRHVNGKFPGKIYCGIGAHAELVEYDIESGNTVAFLPDEFRDRSFTYYTDRFRDMLLAVVTPKPVILFFDPRSHRLLRKVGLPPGAEGLWLGCSDNFVQAGSDLYFGTSPDDNLYRYNYDRDETVLAHEGLGHPFGLADDRYLFCRDYFGDFSVYDVTEDRVVFRRSTNFEGTGMDIYAMAEGPDNTVVGGTYINQGFFIYEPSGDRLRSLGPAVRFGGQITSLATIDDKVYIAHYTHARISVYDRHSPWNPASLSEPNPRPIGSVGYDQDRVPASLVVGDGRIYFGTTPDYGKLGGALVAFDPSNDSFEVYRNVVDKQSVTSLTGGAADVVYGGTDIRGGLGVEPTAREAKLFAWNTSLHRKIEELAPVPGAAAIRALCPTGDGRLLGAGDSTLFLYDTQTSSLLATASTDFGPVLKVVSSRDGWCYGVSHEALFRFSADLRTVQPVLRQADPGFAHVLVETGEGRLFLAMGAELFELIRNTDLGN